MLCIFNDDPKYKKKYFLRVNLASLLLSIIFGKKRVDCILSNSFLDINRFRYFCTSVDLFCYLSTVLCYWYVLCYLYCRCHYWKLLLEIDPGILKRQTLS